MGLAKVQILVLYILRGADSAFPISFSEDLESQVHPRKDMYPRRDVGRLLEKFVGN